MVPTVYPRYLRAEYMTWATGLKYLILFFFDVAHINKTKRAQKSLSLVEWAILNTLQGVVLFLGGASQHT